MRTTEPQPVDVVIAGDALAFRRRVRLLLDEYRAFKIVGEVAPTREAMRVLHTTNAQLLIVDLPRIDARAEAFLASVRGLPRVPVTVVLSDIGNEDARSHIAGLGLPHVLDRSRELGMLVRRVADALGLEPFEPVVTRSVPAECIAAIEILTHALHNERTREIGRTLDAAFSNAGACLGLKRAFVYILRGEHLVPLYRWRESSSAPDGGVAATTDFPPLHARTFPYLWRRIRQEGMIEFGSTRELPDEAEGERAALAALGVDSLIATPIVVNERLAGFVGLDGLTPDFLSTRWSHQMARVIGQLAAQVVERGESAKALRQVESDYQSIVEEANYGIYRTTEDGFLLSANPAMARMLGYDTPAQIVGLNIAASIYKDPADRRRLVASIKGRAHGLRVQWKRMDGREITVSLSGRVVLDRVSGERQFEFFAEDVSELVELETRLRQSQKMEVLGQFAGGLAHDLNNVITAIGANADLLRTALLEQRSAIPQEVDDILSATRRVHRLLQRLLDFARARELALIPLDLAQLIVGLEPLLRPLLPARIRFAHTLVPDVKPVLADATAIEQILVNLVINARDSIAGRGSIDVEVRAASDDEVAAALAGGQVPAVAIVVRDSGAGIEAEDFQQIFEPFHSSKPRGTGLGLFMVRSLSRQLMGEVLVSSEQGQGSTFTVLLPAATPESAAPLDVKEEPPAAERILLVEDSLEVGDLARRILVQSGYAVFLARTPDEAIAEARLNGERLRLVITDGEMGGPCFGEFLREIGVLPPELPILRIETARAPRNCPGSGSRISRLPKPWDRNALLKATREGIRSA